MDVAAGNWAFKEWAVIVHALLEGEQILDVRKGGLREDGRHFSVQATRLWLYPTAEHQKPELLKEPYRHWIDLAHAAPVGEPITLEGWADVVEVATVTEPEELDAIASKLIWTSDYAASRLGWKRPRPAVGAGAARAPAGRAGHGGVGRRLRRLHLVGRARRPARRPRRRCRASPALSDVAFEARLKGAVEALPSLTDAAPDLLPSDARSVGVGGPRRSVRVVPAVARLGQRVGREGGEASLTAMSSATFSSASGVVDVEVVDDLVPLVAEVAGVLEARRSLHRRRDYVLAPSARRRPDATEGAEAPSVRSLGRNRRTACVGGTSSHPSWRRRSGVDSARQS